MNKNYLFAGLIIIVLLAIGVWMRAGSGGPGPAAPDTTTNTQAPTTPDVVGSIPAPVPPTKPGAGVPAFKSIFAESGNHECKYEQVTSTGRTSNVVRIADGKMRGEFRTTTGTVTSANLMVYSGGALYVWQEGKTTGNKSSINSISQLPYAIPVDLASGKVLGTSSNNVSWDCHTWIPDAKQLSAPSYVTFSAR